MRVACLFSGGKDSTYAAYVAMQRGWEVSALLTVRPADPDSMMFHTPNLALTAMQAEAMGLPRIEETAAPGEDGELDALRRIFRRADADGIVLGAIASDYPASRVHHEPPETGLRVYAPHWRQDPTQLVRDYLASGMRVVMSSVSADGFDATWLGRAWDAETVRQLLELRRRRGVHPCGEGGEFETLVLDAPFFRRAIEVLEARPEWRGTSGIWRVERAQLVDKA